MPKFSMVGTFHCLEGKNDEMDAALAAQVAAVADDDEVEVYSYHRGEGTSYAYFAVFTSPDAMQRVSQTEAMQAAMAQFGPLLDGQPEMMMGTPLSAKGLDL
jgi:quinol monooxygenase YgiN